MENNLKHIDDRLAVHRLQLVECDAQIKAASNDADLEAFERAERLKKRVESEIKALTEMRKFYAGGVE